MKEKIIRVSELKKNWDYKVLPNGDGGVVVGITRGRGVWYYWKQVNDWKHNYIGRYSENNGRWRRKWSDEKYINKIIEAEIWKNNLHQ